MSDVHVHRARTTFVTGVSHQEIYKTVVSSKSFPTNCRRSDPLAESRDGFC